MSARSLGFDEGRLEHLVRTIEADVGRERYDGAAVLVARRGEIALHEAAGFAERASERKARTDDVFCLFSVTKTFTSAAWAPAPPCSGWIRSASSSSCA
jgi:CubicO group peptidase (beta-lactamase class C family)